MDIPALPFFQGGKRFVDTYPLIYGNRSPQLEQAVIENWSDEVAAFRDFALTRGGRTVTRTIGLSALSGIYHATKVRWIRYTVKGAVRFIPVIGWGLLAYDLYNLGEDLDLY